MWKLSCDAKLKTLDSACHQVCQCVDTKIYSGFHEKLGQLLNNGQGKILYETEGIQWGVSWCFHVVLIMNNELQHSLPENSIASKAQCPQASK